jgi:hypothetical protein
MDTSYSHRSAGEESGNHGLLTSGQRNDPDENILVYLNNLGLKDEQHCLVLTPSQHYYYNEEDLKDIRTMVNLKELNQIKDVDKFLHSLFRILQPGASFVGCFEDSEVPSVRIHNEKPSGLLTWFLSFLEGKAGRKISRHQVYELLESHGFKIFDMKVINGLTYFYSTNVRKEVS